MLKLAVMAQNMVASAPPALPGGSATEVLDDAEGVFGIVQKVFTAIGIVIVIMVLWRVVKAAAKGEFSKLATTAIGGLLAAALCFNLSIPISMVDGLGNLVQAVFNTLSNLTSGE